MEKEYIAQYCGRNNLVYVPDTNSILESAKWTPLQRSKGRIARKIMKKNIGAIDISGN